MPSQDDKAKCILSVGEIHVELIGKSGQGQGAVKTLEDIAIKSVVIKA